jgi:hypothetical protein
MPSLQARSSFPAPGHRRARTQSLGEPSRRGCSPRVPSPRRSSARGRGSGTYSGGRRRIPAWSGSLPAADARHDERLPSPAAMLQRDERPAAIGRDETAAHYLRGGASPVPPDTGLHKRHPSGGTDSAVGGLPGGLAAFPPRARRWSCRSLSDPRRPTTCWHRQPRAQSRLDTGESRAIRLSTGRPNGQWFRAERS